MRNGILSIEEFDKIFNSQYEFYYETIINKEIERYLKEKYNLKIKRCFFENHFRYNSDRNNHKINHICVYIYFYDDYKKYYVDKMIYEKNVDVLIDLKEYVFEICVNNKFQNYINIDDLLVRFDCFENEACGFMNQKSFEKLKTEFIPSFFNEETMQKMYSSLCVIYKNQTLLDNAISSGETDKINKAFYKFIKPYDDYGFLNEENTQVRFDCMENVEAHGGWFHYDREFVL